MIERYGKPAFVVLAFIIFGSLMHLLIKEENRKKALIDSGLCTVDAQGWFESAPTMICTYRNPDGMCMVHTPVENPPYFSQHWKCPGESFWRKP